MEAINLGKLQDKFVIENLCVALYPKDVFMDKIAFFIIKSFRLRGIPHFITNRYCDVLNLPLSCKLRPLLAFAHALQVRSKCLVHLSLMEY